MKGSEIIRVAINLIEKSGWSQHSHCRDSLGNAIPMLTGGERSQVNPNAVSFSIYAALCKVMENERVEDAPGMWEVLSTIGRERAGQVSGGTNYVHPVMGINDADVTIDDVKSYLKECADYLDGPSQGAPIVNVGAA